MMQWDYFQVAVESDKVSDTFLQQFGSKGWELVTVVPQYMRPLTDDKKFVEFDVIEKVWFFFKRPKLEESNGTADQR